MKELISVIVPVHNGQDYLEKCIDSIAAQTYDCLEIILVNDGSTDDTAQVCERLQIKYDNVSIISLADVGVAAARNRAIEQAKGAYIAFVDADDRLRPDMLKRLYDSLQASGSDMAGCRFITWSTEDEWERIIDGQSNIQNRADMDGNNVALQTSARRTAEGKAYDGYHYLTDHILQNNSRCWSKLYRRSMIGQVRFREELTIGEDMLFLVDLLPGLTRAVELEYEGYGYYQNPGGLMRRPFKPAYMDQIKCWELAKEEILKIDPALVTQVNAKLMIAIMLTVGKIAMLSGKESMSVKGYLDICEQKMSLYCKCKDAYQYLPEGYGMKVGMFSRTPGLYVMLYHLLQKIKH